MTADVEKGVMLPTFGWLVFQSSPFVDSARGFIVFFHRLIMGRLVFAAWIANGVTSLINLVSIL